MHYGAYGFATDPYVPTITTRDRFHQYTIGQREGPSFLDFAAVNYYTTSLLMHVSYMSRAQTYLLSILSKSCTYIKIC